MMLQQRTAQLGETDYVRFRDLVSEKCGLDFPQTRRADLERAIVQVLAETDSSDYDSLYRLLIQAERTNPALELLVSKLTIGETHFFRNQPQFQALEQHILPELIAARRETRTLRVWSAACASGEEPYSLAILLDRLLPDLADWNILLLASDINPRVLDKARRGIYSAWSFREVPPDIQQKYFTARGREIELAPHIRERVTFIYLNLAEDVYPSLLNNTNAMDLILCRNVLIYFHEGTIRRVVGRFHESLAENGWLIVGHAEPSQAIFHQFAVRNFPGTTVYQKSASDHQPPIVQSLPPRLESAPMIAARAPRPAPRSQPTYKPQPAAPSATQRALALWEEGKTEEALRALKEIAAANGADASVYYLIAKIHANLLQLDAAEEWIGKAVNESTLFAPAYYLRSLILQERGKLADASEAMRRCLYADPQFALGYFAQATLFSRQHQPHRARKALDNVARLLDGRKRDELIAEGDGVTVGRLLELVAAQKELL